MLPNHTLPEPLNVGKDTVAFFARAPKNKLVVFVHGFGGGATSTWDPMHELLPLQPQSAGWDIVFYGYHSVSAPALNSANLLRQFISEFVASRARTIAPRGSATQKAPDVLIAGHSLGALIARQAVLDAFTQQVAWATRTRLLLFGAAHCGADITVLAGELLASIGPIGAVATSLFQFGSPALRDLNPNGPFVQKLQQDTIAALKRHPKAPLKADHVLWGEFDRVVRVQNFCKDPASFTVAKKRHMNVCKPAGAYLLPLNEVVSRL